MNRRSPVGLEQPGPGWVRLVGEGRGSACGGLESWPMSAAVADGAGSSGPPFANASPAQIRTALTSEDAAAFDEHWRAVMRRATDSLDLSELFEALEAWRRIAWLSTAHGHDGYRQMLSDARERVRTGGEPEGTISWGQLMAELGPTE